MPKPANPSVPSHIWLSPPQEPIPEATSPSRQGKEGSKILQFAILWHSRPQINTKPTKPVTQTTCAWRREQRQDSHELTLSLRSLTAATYFSVFPFQSWTADSKVIKGPEQFISVLSIWRKYQTLKKATAHLNFNSPGARYPWPANYHFLILGHPQLPLLVPVLCGLQTVPL